jgi:MtN3 and saliva related transmembrane protein
MLWTIIGFSAAILTMFSFVPQIIRTIQTKSVKDVSRMTLLQLSAGVLLWIVYGLHLKNIVIILANFITLTSLIILLVLCRIYRGAKVNN